MTNSDQILIAAHLLAGRVLRKSKPLTKDELRHVLAARVYLNEMLGIETLPRNDTERATLAACETWRELGSDADRDDQAHDSAALGRAQGTRRG